MESYDDVFFWRTILSQLEDSTRYFEVMLPAYGHLGRGKKSAMKMLLRNTGKDMIACVDADYDYLLQGASESSKLMLSTPYVFHSHAYAIENLQCYAEGLHNVCVMVTLNDHRIFNCRRYLLRYSRIVHPLLVLSVWLYRHGKFDIMSITDMDHVITPQKFAIERADALLDHLAHKVRQQINHLHRRIAIPDLNHQLSLLAEELQTLGVTPNTAYLYVHGHHLFEKVVVPMLTNICTRLRLERERDIHNTSLHTTQMNNELSCYTNSLENISSMLKKNTSYLLSPQCQQVVNDIRRQLSVK